MSKQGDKFQTAFIVPLEPKAQRDKMTDILERTLTDISVALIHIEEIMMRIPFRKMGE